MLPALLKKCLLEGSLVLFLECTDLCGVRLLWRLDLRGRSPLLCGVVIAPPLRRSLSTTPRSRFFVGFTSESESPVSWASDFSDLTCTAFRSHDRNSFSNNMRTWSATGSPPMVVNFDKRVQRLWYYTWALEQAKKKAAEAQAEVSDLTVQVNHEKGLRVELEGGLAQGHSLAESLKTQLDA